MTYFTFEFVPGTNQ